MMMQQEEFTSVRKHRGPTLTVLGSIPALAILGRGKNVQLLVLAATFLRRSSAGALGNGW